MQTTTELKKKKALGSSVCELKWLNYKKRRAQHLEISEQFYTLAQISKNGRHTNPLNDIVLRGQGSDLAPIFGDLFEIRSPLVLVFHNLENENICLFPSFKRSFQPITIQCNSQNYQAVLQWVEMFAER